MVTGVEKQARPHGAGGGQVNVNVVGMPEFDELMDHIYEYGTASEGVIERANAFARAVIARYAPQQPADVEVVFIDGVGAARSSVKSCRGGVQWIRIKNRVYWPLSDADAQRLQSACCGNGSFDGPTTPAGEGGQAMTDQSTHAHGCWSWGPRHYECALREIEALREVLQVLVNWTPSADTYRRMGFNPEVLMRAHDEAKALLAKGNK